jgi:hypothetical protein
MSYSQQAPTRPRRTPSRTGRLGPALAVLAAAALIVAGCGSEDAGSATSASAGTEQAVKYAECMRDNGVSEFPDPDASGELTIDGVLNGTSVDPSSAAWKQATAACDDLQPAGFTGDHDVSDAEQALRLQFAQCMRENGVPDFPDPGRDDPLIDTRKIPSAAGGLDAINAAADACGDIAEKAIGQ